MSSITQSYNYAGCTLMSLIKLANNYAGYIIMSKIEPRLDWLISMQVAYKTAEKKSSQDRLNCVQAAY